MTKLIESCLQRWIPQHLILYSLLGVLATSAVHFYWPWTRTAYSYLAHASLQWLLAVGLLLLLVYLLRQAQTFTSQYMRLFWLLLWPFMAWLFMATAIAQQQSQQWQDQAGGKSRSVLIAEGKVVDVVMHKGHYQRFKLQLDRSSSMPQKSSAFLRKGQTLVVSWYHADETVRPGERWRFKLRIKPVIGQYNTHGFDYERWSFIRGHSVRATVVKLKANEEQPSAINLRLNEATAWSVSAFRQAVSEHLLAANISERNKAVLAALLVADRGHLSSEQWQLFQATGTAHLLAISGLHLSLVAGISGWLVWLLYAVAPSMNRLLIRPYAIAVFAVSVSFSYALLAGMHVPVMRSWLMVAAAALSLLLSSPQVRLKQFFLVLLVLWLMQPLAVYGASFWLSALAVFCIVLFFHGRLAVKSSRPRLFWQAIKLQWMLSLLMMPVAALFFNQLSLISPLSNILLIPFMGFILMPMAVLYLLIFVFSPAVAGGLLPWLDAALSVMDVALLWFAQWPWAQFKLAARPLLLALFAIAAVLLLLAPRGWLIRWLSAPILAIFFMWPSARPVIGAFEVTVLDVGQGLSVLIETAKHNLLYDTGVRFNERYDMGKMVVLPYLQAAGIRKLDVAMITHEDSDHRGGLSSVDKGVVVDRIISNVSAQALHVKREIRACNTGQRWQWDGVIFEVLWPTVEANASVEGDNNLSCVLRISNAYHSVLLTADIEVEAEHELVKRLSAKEFDDLRPTVTSSLSNEVMLAPHHGSKTSSSASFLRAVNPSLAIVAAGYQNAYHHPHPSVLRRYREQGIAVMNTADSGAIHIAFPNTQQDYEVRQTRTQRRYFWQQPRHFSALK